MLEFGNFPGNSATTLALKAANSDISFTKINPVVKLLLENGGLYKATGKSCSKINLLVFLFYIFILDKQF